MNVAFVLLSKPELPSGEAIVRAFAGFAAKGETLSLFASNPADRSVSEILEFEVRPGGTGLVLFTWFAVPDGEAEAAVRFSLSAMGTGWKLPPHAAHLVVSLGNAGGASPVACLSAFTALVAAVTEASRAVGVYWGSAGATHDPEFVLSLARDEGLAPRVMLWNGVGIGREPDGRLTLLSLGMEQLQLPDLQLIAPGTQGGEVLGTLFDLLTYVTERGEAILEGETVGRSAEERLPVRYVPSPIDPRKQVWQVELP